MLAITNKTPDSKVYITKFIEYDKQAIEDAKLLFQQYKDEEIIKNNSYDEHSWIITNETITIEVGFEFSETLFYSEKKQNKRQLGSYVDFVNAVKIYIVHTLNHTSLLVIQRFISNLKNVLKQTKYFNPNFSDDLLKKVKFNSANYLLMLIELTNFFPLDDIELFQEQCRIAYDELSETINTNKLGEKQQRQLAEFQSFFLFDKLINQFWNYMANDEEKLSYFPVYLWWSITNILPLRPTELMVTPFNCIRKDDSDEYFLTIRRTNLKGHKKGKSKGIVTHKVDFDYTLYEYPVSKDIADLISDYQRRVEKFEEKRKFLFSKKAYQESLGIYKEMSKLRSRSSEFTLKNLRVVMARFYKNIIEDKFGIKLYYKKHHALGEDKLVFEEEDTFLNHNEIMVINIGDTRHFSMVNIVLNDFNPILIKDFAGHEDINQSYHYFDHIDKIVKCMTHYKFHELRRTISDDGSIVFNETINLETIASEIEGENVPYIEIEHGKCFSKKFYVGDISDCIPSYGNCTNCEFSRIDNHKYNDVIKIRRVDLERRLREEGLLLQNILTKFNETHDEYAEFQRIILRVQQATTEYVNISSKLISGDYNDNPKG